MEFHTSPLGGHSGFLKPYPGVKKECFWDSLKSNIQNFVAVILLQYLSIPSKHWEEVSMDFITGLPKSKGKSVIMVVVDRITNYVHFCALSHPFKVSTVATTFMDRIQKLHGSPRVIVGDRDPIFTGNFWTELFSCLGTQLALIILNPMVKLR